jgi:hypothetical protein
VWQLVAINQADNYVSYHSSEVTAELSSSADARKEEDHISTLHLDI